MIDVKEYWLIIEGYVHISLKKSNVLFYNTINGESLKYNKRPIIEKLVGEIIDRKNQYVIKLKTIYDDEIMEFVEDLRRTFMGDIIETELSEKKPICFYPIFNNQQEISQLISTNWISDGENIITCINELTLYLNHYNRPELKGYETAYKQFNYPYSDIEKSSLNYDALLQRINELSESSIYNINILGTAILEYKQLPSILKCFSAQPYKKTIIIRLLDLEDEDRIKPILIGLNDTFEISCIVDSYDDIAKNIGLIELLKGVNIKSEIIFVVSDEDQLDKIDQITNLVVIEALQMIPFYNGNNSDFFEKHVYIEEQDVLESTKSLEMIFSNQSFNRNHFGKLTILSNGEIYANLNIASIGNIEKDSIKKIIYNEVKHGNSWKKTRATISPCNECTYEFLCPSISNYEYALNKMNLCKVNNL